MNRQQHSRRVAIVGAGISGLTCASILQAAGVVVTVFDKARGPGGRIATRLQHGERFDHGAQFFTARSEPFQREVSRWQSAGVAAPWPGRFGTWSPTGWSDREREPTRWVGIPRMSAIGRHLSAGLDVELSTRIIGLERTDRGWSLQIEGLASQTPYDAVVISCPGPQACVLLPPSSPTHQAAMAMEYQPCWTAMVVFDGSVDVPYDGIELEHPVLSWAARERSKPGRAIGERWVLHASPRWSEEQLDIDPGEVGGVLCGEFSKLCGQMPVRVTVHRWRYGRSVPRSGKPFVFDAEQGLGLCGDGLTRPRVEGAWQSGRALGEHMVDAGWTEVRML